VSVERILVLRQGTHGLPTGEYADALRERLPGHTVVHARTPREERELVEDATVVSSGNIGEDLLGRAEQLRLFAGVAAGYNHLPLDTFREMDVAVTNASGIHAPNIAEQVLGYVLLFTRRLDKGLRRQRNREWRHFQSHELKGSTVTVVGLGSIGTAVLRRLDGFGVETVGVRHTPEKGGPADRIIGFGEDDFHDALADTDYLVLSCPLTETTRGLVDAAEFATLPPNAVVVNVGRGPVVDTGALVSAIQNNSVRGAALDVTDPEPLPPDHVLWTFGNVLVTPHNAGHSPKHWDRLADILARNVQTIEATGSYDDLENLVVSPDESASPRD
jgi:phosphoglycerate dehydrogenase-like enzyme